MFVIREENMSKISEHLTSSTNNLLRVSYARTLSPGTFPQGLSYKQDGRTILKDPMEKTDGVEAGGNRG